MEVERVDVREVGVLEECMCSKQLQSSSVVQLQELGSLLIVGRISF
ncbi:hypothetical protein [Acinetobacter baylyi]|nr:hypothetical protein [Acinetobacter baylyi]